MLLLCLSLRSGILDLKFKVYTDDFDDGVNSRSLVVIKSMSFPVIACSFVAVEVKKEPEPPTETVKQEEREPATKSSAPAPPSKPPPEKRARLQ